MKTTLKTRSHLSIIVPLPSKKLVLRRRTTWQEPIICQVTRKRRSTISKDILLMLLCSSTRWRTWETSAKSTRKKMISSQALKEWLLIPANLLQIAMNLLHTLKILGLKQMIWDLKLTLTTWGIQANTMEKATVLRNQTLSLTSTQEILYQLMKNGELKMTGDKASVMILVPSTVASSKTSAKISFLKIIVKDLIPTALPLLLVTKTPIRGPLLQRKWRMTSRNLLLAATNSINHRSTTRKKTTCALAMITADLSSLAQL